MFTLRSRLVLIAVMLLSLSAGLAHPAAAQDATPAADGITVDGVTVLPPDESYAGADRGEWNARSWQWSASMPVAVSPNFDPTGEHCGYGQFGPVFFLPASYTPEPDIQTCVVPEGTAIFVPVIGVECSSVEPPPFFGRNEEELRACAAAATDTVVEMQVTINGQEVPDLESYRSSSPLFTLNLPADNFLGVPEGVALSVTEGYSFIIAPPPPSEYEITVSTQLEGESKPFVSTIYVVVQAPQVIEPGATPEGGTPVATPGA